MRFLLFVLFLLDLSDVALADEVKIFGSAATPSGQQREVFESFPEQTPPQINIVKTEPKPVPEKPAKPVIPDTIRAQKINEINQFSPQDPKPFSISPQEEQNEIENTLYEGGNRIYDVQSFPLKDIKIITEPNIDPTISTYPEY